MIARSEYPAPSVDRSAASPLIQRTRSPPARVRAIASIPGAGSTPVSVVAGARERARDQAGAAPEVHDCACPDLGRELQAEVRLRVRLRTR